MPQIKERVYSRLWVCKKIKIGKLNPLVFIGGPCALKVENIHLKCPQK